MHKEILKKIAILSGSIIVVSGAAIAANIPQIARENPQIPLSTVEMLTTIPAFFIIFSVLFSNRIAKMIGYKQTVLLGLIIVAISGLIPVFISNFWVVFLSRVFFGIGVGLFNSLLVSFIGYFYKGKERATLIGFQSAFEGIGGMLITFTVGQLLKISWQTSFLVYLITIPILLMFTLFVPKVSYQEMHQQKIVNKQLNQAAGNDVSKKGIIGYILLLFVVVMFYMTITVKVTTLMTTFDYGNATDGSNILSLIGVGAMSAGFLFGKIFSITGKFTLPISFLILGSALLTIGLSNSVLVTGIAAMICGFSFRTFIPYLFHRVNSATTIDPNFSTSLLLVGFNLGSTFTPYSIALIEKMIGSDSPRMIFFVEATVLFLFSIVGMSYLLLKKNNSIIHKTT